MTSQLLCKLQLFKTKHSIKKKRPCFAGSFLRKYCNVSIFQPINQLPISAQPHSVRQELEG